MATARTSIHSWASLGYYGGPTRAIPPLPESVAIEGGIDAGIDVDQRGIGRPQLAQFDIGALELQERRARQRYTGGFTTNPHRCDLDRNGRVDFADLDRLIASFPVVGGNFRGNADATSAVVRRELHPRRLPARGADREATPPRLVALDRHE